MPKTRRIRLKNKMDPHSGAPRQWDVPAMVSVAELADCLETSSRTLTWLAAAGRSARSSQHYHCKWIRKRVGLRLIESPKPKLKTIQRQILRKLLQFIPASEAAHGFVGHRNANSFVRPHVQQTACLKMDLKNFFPSISAKRIYGLFRCTGYPNEVAHILTGLCTTATPTSILGELATHCCSGQVLAQRYALPHLPQGAPTSPMLSNLCAYRMDQRLNGLARTLLGSYTRYADDILISLTMARKDRQTNSRMKRLAHQVAVIAMQEGFEVNFRKTRIMHQSQRQMAAGIVFNQKPNVSRRYFDRLKAILYHCATRGPSEQNRNNVPDFRAHLLGQIAWVGQQNPNRGEKLMQVFRRIDWR